MKRILFFLLFSCVIVFFQPQLSLSGENNPEIVFWETIKDSKDPMLYQMYLNKYPNGTFSELAEFFRQKYSSESSVQAAPTTPSPVKEKPRTVVKKSINNLAIFPFKFYDDGHYMKGVLMNNISRIADRYKCLQFTHSYYDMDAKYSVEDLSDNSVISRQSIAPRNLWNGIMPNTDSISEIGTELGADTVITGTLNIDNPWSDSYTLGYIRIFMIDVATGELIKARNRTLLGDARDVLPSVIQEAIGSYAEEFCQ